MEKLRYPKCDRDPSHTGEPMNFICLERGCEYKGILCSECRNSTKHNNKHDVVSAKIFFEGLQTAKKEIGGYHHAEKYLQELECIYYDVLGELRRSVEALAQVYRTVEEQISKYYSFLKQRIVDQTLANKHVSQHLGMMADIVDDTAIYRQQVCKMVDLVKHNKITNEFLIQYDPDKLTKGFREKKTPLVQILDSVEKLSTQKLTGITSLLQKAMNADIAANTLEPYRFSNTMHAKTIVVSEEMKIATQNQSSNSDMRFALIEDSLPIDKSSTISIRVKKCQNWVGLGICFKSVIVDSKSYKFTYNNLGHGSYLMSTNGFTWSNHRAQDNIKNQGFLFSTGSKIILTFDPVAQTLTYELDQKPNKFVQKIAIDPSKHLNDVYFCVNLCSKGDEASLEPL